MSDPQSKVFVQLCREMSLLYLEKQSHDLNQVKAPIDTKFKRATSEKRREAASLMNLPPSVAMGETQTCLAYLDLRNSLLKHAIVASVR